MDRYRMNRSAMILLMSMWACSSGYAMTLDDAITAALSHENQLKLSGLSVNQAAAVLQQAKKQSGVNINLAGQLGVEKIDSTDAANPFFQTDGVRHPRALELQFDYPIYTSGRKSLGVEVAKMQLNAQNQAFSGQKATTILNTVQVYTDVLKQQAMLTLKQKVVQNLQKSLSDAQKRFKAGVITRADLAQVQSQYAQGQADVVLAQSNLDVSSAQFYQVIGQSPEQLQSIRRVPSVPNSVDQVLRMVSNHPMVQKAKFEQQAADKQYKLVKRELTPTLNVTSRVSKQNEISNFDSKSDNYMVGLQLNVPLFDQGLNRANRQKAQADVDLAQEKIQAVEQDLGKRAQTTFAQLQAVRQNKQALNEAIDAAALAFNFIQKELEFGNKTTFDALNAEQTLKDLQTQKLLNEQDEVVLVYQLLDQMGQLNAADSNSNIASPSSAALPLQSNSDDMLYSSPVAQQTQGFKATPIRSMPIASVSHAAKTAVKTKQRQVNSTSNNAAVVDFVPMQPRVALVNSASTASLPSAQTPMISIAAAPPISTASTAAVQAPSATAAWYNPWSWLAKKPSETLPVSPVPKVKTNVLVDDGQLNRVALPPPPQLSQTAQMPNRTTQVQAASQKSVFKPWTWFSKSPSAKPVDRVAPLVVVEQTPILNTSSNISKPNQTVLVKPTSVSKALDVTSSKTATVKPSKTKQLKGKAAATSKASNTPKVFEQKVALAPINSTNQISINVQQELAAMPVTQPTPVAIVKPKASMWQKLTGLFKKQPATVAVPAFETVQVHSPNLTERVRYRPVITEQK